MAPTYRTLRYHSQPPVVWMTLDSPHSSNRINVAMAAELRLACQQLREEGAYVAVLTGAGQSFSEGREPLSPPKYEAGHLRNSTDWLETHRVASVLADVEIPTIAAINGPATDHGLELALACDFRACAKGALLGFTDVSKGTMPWDGGTQRLTRLIGKARALEMLLTCRLIDADEAYRIGLVNTVVEPQDLLSYTQELAMKISSGAPIATRYTKEAVSKGMDMTLSQGLKLEADLSVILQSTVDRTEGVSSFLDRRTPNFKGQ